MSCTVDLIVLEVRILNSYENTLPSVYGMYLSFTILICKQIYNRNICGCEHYEQTFGQNLLFCSANKSLEEQHRNFSNHSLTALNSQHNQGNAKKVNLNNLKLYNDYTQYHKYTILYYWYDIFMTILNLLV